MRRFYPLEYHMARMGHQPLRRRHQWDSDEITIGLIIMLTVLIWAPELFRLIRPH